MLPINEIRVGNTLCMNGKNFILSEDFFSRILAEPHLLEKIQPVFVTEEVLEKAGFHRLDEPGGWTLQHVFVYKVYIEDQVFYEIHFVKEFEDRVTLPQRLKFIHKLQNLYFEVTGVELPCILE
jgi:hypothetical protein